jgi:hypothetical protein
MYTAKCSHAGCERKFTKPNKSRAQQALLMHVGRTHNGHIKAPHEENGDDHSGVLVAQSVAVGRSTKVMRRKKIKLSREEARKVAEFINKNKDDFDTKSGCFAAAFECNGLTGRVDNNGPAVVRYFAKAKQLAALNGTGKRKYGKRHQPVETVTHKTINFCSHCGSDLKTQALASVLAERIRAGASIVIDGEKVEYAG